MYALKSHQNQRDVLKQQHRATGCVHLHGVKKNDTLLLNQHALPVFSNVFES